MHEGEKRKINENEQVGSQAKKLKRSDIRYYVNQEDVRTKVLPEDQPAAGCDAVHGGVDVMHDAVEGDSVDGEDAT